MQRCLMAEKITSGCVSTVLTRLLFWGYFSLGQVNHWQLWRFNMPSGRYTAANQPCQSNERHTVLQEITQSHTHISVLYVVIMGVQYQNNTRFSPHHTYTYSSAEDMTMLMRPDSGLNLAGIESQVFRPIMTALILPSYHPTKTKENKKVSTSAPALSKKKQKYYSCVK